MNVSLSLSLSVPPWPQQLMSPGSVPAAKNSWAGMCVHGTTVQDFIFVLFISFFISVFPLRSFPMRSFFFQRTSVHKFFMRRKKSWLTEDETSSRGKGGKGRHENTRRNRGMKSATVRPWRQLSELVVNDSVGHFLTLKAAFVIKLLTQPLKKNNKKLT